MNFLVIVLVEIVLTIFMIIGVIEIYKKIKERTISKVNYIFIIVAVMSLVIYIPSMIIPKVKDVAYLVNGDFEIVHGICNKVKESKAHNEITIDGENLKIDSWTIYPEVGKEYKVKFLPNSRWVIDCK